MILLAATLAYSAYRLSVILRIEKESASYYAALRGESAPQPGSTAPPDARMDGSGAQKTPPEAAEAQKSPSGIDFAALQAINPDAVGWLSCEDTVIDYPVVQGADNAYYLTHMFNGEENKAGALFLDCRNAHDFSDGNNVVYGHHMKNGSMLASIVEYKAQTYFDAHPTLMLYTKNGDYLVELFSGYVARDEAVVTAPQFGGETAFADFVKKAKAKSTFESDAAPKPGDRILTLVTCTYETRNARYVLHGRLLPIEADF